MITLDDSFFEEIQRFDWFSSVGLVLPQFPFPAQPVQDEKTALQELLSDSWVDVKTEAQGDLTGYLASHHPQAYGVVWRGLVKQSTNKLNALILPELQNAVTRRGWSFPAIQQIMLDLTRAALERSYRRQFRGAPEFFGRLICIYRNGHLPCGWLGDADQWPLGKFAVY